MRLLKARMSNYLNTLKKEMNTIGFNGGYLVTRSGSGSMTFDEAEDRPFETINVRSCCWEQREQENFQEN